MTDEDLWRTASTLRDLGELAARWLEGSIAYQPGYLAEGPEDETADLIPVLAGINRAGFWTDQSQPGELAEGWQQRAFVSGYADDEIAGPLMELGHSDLVVMASPPGIGMTRGQVVVSREGSGENTWVGIMSGSDELRSAYAGSLGALALNALLASWELHIFDPVWGRNDRLWPALAQVARDAL